MAWFPADRPARGRGWRRGVLAWALLALAAYAALLAALWLGQERLLFRPQPLPADTVLANAADLHETWVDVPGARLSMLWLRLPRPAGVVFYLHGNGGNLASWFVNADFYRRANFDLVMLDYRGYGKSTGRISSQDELLADVRAAWQQVAPHYAGQRVVLLGRSLGTGLAAELASQVQPDLTVLVSPYASMAALARRHYPWVPEAVLRYPLRTDQVIGRLRHPVLLLHGERDDLIPLQHSQALLARQPAARLVVVLGAGHNDLHTFDTYLQAVAGALAALR
jgi:uncharacterized protein